LKTAERPLGWASAPRAAVLVFSKHHLEAFTAKTAKNYLPVRRFSVISVLSVPPW